MTLQGHWRMWVELANVQIVRSKGRLYAYHRPTKTPITGKIGSPAFMRRMTELNEQMERPKAEPGDRGTIADLVLRYKASTAFKQLSPVAKKDYRRYLDIISRGRCGRLLGDQVTNGFMVVRRVLRVAVQREWIAKCPALAQKQERLKEGPGYKPWPEPAIRRFREQAPVEMVLAMELALHTGQRQADLLAMKWGQIRNGEITLTQQKPGDAAEEMVIPISADLAHVLADIEKKGIYVLTGNTGQPWEKYTFRHKFGDAVRACGLRGLVYHRLRHTAAKRLAELGLSDRLIASVIGHKSTDSVKLYTRTAAQKKFARIAIAKIEQS